MKFVNFFIVMWIVIGFAWQSTDTPHGPTTKWYRVLEQVILAPVVFVKWVKIGVHALLNKTK